MASAPALPADGTITMFSTTWCGYCTRLKTQLDREGIGYTEVNIEHDPASAAYVLAVNGGNQTVPPGRVLRGDEAVDLDEPLFSLVFGGDGDLREGHRALEHRVGPAVDAGDH